VEQPELVHQGLDHQGKDRGPGLLLEEDLEEDLGGGARSDIRVIFARIVLIARDKTVLVVIMGIEGLPGELILIGEKCILSMMMERLRKSQMIQKTSKI
jgi:hypothetical protein